MYSLCVEAWRDWLTALMKRLNVNNKGMASLVGVSPTTIGNWLAGGPPEAGSILRLAELAKRQPTEIFTIAYGVASGGDTADLDPLALELVHLAAGRSDAEQEAILATVKALVENFDRGKRE